MTTTDQTLSGESAAPPAEAVPPPAEAVTEHEEPHPRGTLALLVMYLAVLIGFWGYLYSLLFR